MGTRFFNQENYFHPLYGPPGPILNLAHYSHRSNFPWSQNQNMQEYYILMFWPNRAPECAREQ